MLAHSTVINQIPYRSRGKMKHTTPTYHVYMLRIWKEKMDHPHAPEIVRMSVEDTRTGKRVGFVDWDQLLKYLKEQVGESPPKQ